MAKLRGSKNSILETCVEMLNEGLSYSESEPDIFIVHVMACIRCLENEIAKPKTMKTKTKLLLKEAYDICKKEDRSLAYAVQYMCVFASVDENCVANWLGKYSGDYETKTK